MRKEGIVAYNFKVQATVVGRQNHEAAGYMASSQGARGNRAGAWLSAFCFIQSRALAQKMVWPTFR